MGSGEDGTQLFMPRPLVRQPTRIEAIDGNRVTIADPLLHGVSENLPAYFTAWDHLSDVGNGHNVLVTRNEVFNPTVHTFSFNTQASRSVYQRSTGWEQPTLGQHSGANHQNLYDGVTVLV